MEFRILRQNGDKLQYDATNAAPTNSQTIVNNTISSFFSDSCITAKGIKSFMTLSKLFSLQVQLKRENPHKSLSLEVLGLMFSHVINTSVVEFH